MVESLTLVNKNFNNISENVANYKDLPSYNFYIKTFTQI